MTTKKREESELESGLTTGGEQSAQPAHVVLMNDAAELLEVMRVVLEEEGYRVTTLPDALTDMRQLADYQPDVVVLDWLFGNEPRGLQVAQAIRLTPDLKDLPIVVCSAAVAEVRAIGSYFEAQNIAVLYKPFDLDSFLAAVAQAAGRGWVSRGDA
jgi:CheY-like chemotaxis protein